MRSLVRCGLCGVRRYESEVVWDKEINDFICKDKNHCTEGYSKYHLQKVRRRRMEILPKN